MLHGLKPLVEENHPLFRFSAISLALLAFPIHAQTVTSVTNGQWDTAATWSNGLAPSTSFDYVIGSGSTVNSPPAPFGTFSYAFDGGSLTVQTGGTLALVGNNNSTIGNVSYSIPGFTINSGGTLALSMQNIGSTDRTLTTGLTLAGPGAVSINAVGGTYNNGLTLAPTAALSGSANANVTMTTGGVNNRKYLRVSSANNTYTGNWNITSTGAAATGDSRGVFYANAANALGTGSVTLTASILINQVADALNSISGVNVGTNSAVQVNANWNAPAATLALTAPTAQVTVSGANTVMNIGNLSGVAGSSITGTGAGESLSLNTTADSLYAGTLGGTLSLTKSGTATSTLTGAGSSVSSANVTAGTLNLAQSGAFTTTGNYATQSGATTQIAANSTLAVGGVFTQAANSTLNVAIGSTQPIINANTANLSGTLNISGLSVPNTASSLSGTFVNVIQTAAPGGITGDFATVTLADNNLNYLQASHVAPNAQNYNVGFGLTWQAGTALGNGVFTLAGASDLFNVDVALANQTGPFTSGWDGTTLTKSGMGTLELSAANTYTGDTLINAGTLRTGAVNSLENSRAVTVANGATLDLNGFNQTINNLSGDGNLATSGAALTANNTTADTTFGGMIGGTGSLIKTGANTLTLTGNNTYSGTTTVNGGTLQIGNGTTTGGIAGNIINNAALAFNSSGASNYGGSITGTGTLTQAGTGTTTLTGTGSSIGNVNVAAGTLDLAQTGTFTSTGNYTTQSNAATQIAANSALAVDGVFTQAANSTLNVAIGSTQPIINANSANLSGTLNITGLGSASNTASALSGTLFNLIHTASPGGITGNFTAVTLGGVANTLDYLQISQLTANTQDYNVGFGLTWQAGSTLGNGVFTLSGASDLFNVDVALANQVGSVTNNWDGTTLTKNGMGTLELSAANTYTGDTLINAGTLRTGAVNTLENSRAVTVANGATLDLNGFNQTINNLSGAGNLATGGAALTANNTTADTTFGGVIGGTGSLVKTGANTLTLTGNNTYSGSTTVSGGTLQIGNGTTIGGIVSDIANNAALVFNHNDDFAYMNSLSGSGSLTKLGNGVLSFAGSNPSTQGNITVGQGTLQLLQNQPFTVTGNYNTEADATTDIGQINSTLRVGGTFTQAANAILSVTLGSSPDIIAQTAVLGGTLVIRGFSDSETPVKASDILNDNEYTMLRTTGGINGSFDNNPLTPSGLDYLQYNGHISANTLDYNLGFQLAWIEGGLANGTGTFTLATNTAFDIDVALSDQTDPFTSGWDGKSLIKKGDGLLVLSAANTYTGSTTIEEGTLALTGDADISTSSSTSLTQAGATLSFAGISGNGTSVQDLSGVSGSQLLLAGKTLTVVNGVDTTFAGNIDASNAGLIKNGSASLTLSGKTAYTGQTQLNEGTLVLDGSQGGAQLTSNVVAQSGTQLSLLNGATLTGWVDPTNVAIDTASQWNMTANSQVDNLSNGGTVTFVAPTADNFKTLTVAGNYQGNNGLLVLNTRLNDDASLTDKLVVEGNTAGTTRVQINNAGGSGAQTLAGIEVISVAGQSDGQFIQSGRIAAGAYDYTLGRGAEVGTAGNWYLTSSTVNPDKPTVRSEAGAYSANLAAANNMFVNRLDDRLGETQYIDALTGEQKVTSMWLRNEGGHNRSRDESGQLHTQANRYVMQLGGDIAQWSNNGLDRLRIGLMAGYGNSKSNTVSRLSGYDAKGTVIGYSVGAYGTWYANAADKSGLYVDGWAQYSWFNNSVNGQYLAVEDYKSKGMTASVESGYTYKLGENAANNISYFIQPQAQLTWMGVKADDHKEANGSHISGEGNDNIQTRLGVKAFINSYSDQDKGKDRVFQPFVAVNWIHNTKDFGAVMDGVSVKQDGAANIAELKAGVDSQLNKQVNLWGNVGQQVGNKGYSDTAVMLGVKYKF